MSNAVHFSHGHQPFAPNENEAKKGAKYVRIGSPPSIREEGDVFSYDPRNDGEAGAKAERAAR